MTHRKEQHKAGSEGDKLQRTSVPYLRVVVRTIHSFRALHEGPLKRTHVQALKVEANQYFLYRMTRFDGVQLRLGIWDGFGCGVVQGVQS